MSMPRAIVVERGGVVSCSVEETNRIRALLGLRPLDPEKPVAPCSGQEDSDPGARATTAAALDGPVLKAQTTERNGEISCSVEETNRIRAALGLRPLAGSEPGPSLSKRREDSRAQQRRREQHDLEQRIEHARKQRMLRARLSGATLGDAQDQDGSSASDWVQRSRTAQEDALRSSDSSKPEFAGSGKLSATASYTSKDLAGLKVAHDVGSLGGLGNEVILTLKDKQVANAATGELDTEEDELENPRLVVEEKIAEKVWQERKIKQKGSLMDIVDDAEGECSSSSTRRVLPQYDEALGESTSTGRRAKKARLVLDGSGGLGSAPASRDLTGSIHRKLAEHSLELEQEAMRFQLMPDMYTPAEYDSLVLDRRGKKSKEKKEKKGKRRKSGKQSKRPVFDDAPNETADAALDDMSDDGAPLELGKRASRRRKRKVAAEAPYVPTHVSEARVGAENDEESASLARALAATRKKTISQRERVDVSVARAVAEDGGAPHAQHSWTGNEELSVMNFSQTAGFASAIQARVESHRNEESKRTDETNVGPERSAKHQPRASTISAAGMRRSEGPRQDQQAMSGFGGDEARVGEGLAATLSFFGSRGELGKPKGASDSVVVGRARDAKPIVDGGEGGVVLEYRDEFGRILTQKEAFRQLNYKFHGHQPGLRKQEKRRKDLERQQRQLAQQEAGQSGTLGLMKKMQEKAGTAHITL